MLSTTTPQLEYTMNGTTLAFDFAFPMWLATVKTEIVVVYQEGETDEATLSHATDYTLSAANNDYGSGGTVTLNSGSAYITSGKTLLIKSDLARSQTYNLEHGGDINVAVLEQTLDRLVRMLQEAEAYSSISRTALDTSILANLANIVCYNGAVVCYGNDVVTYNP